MGKKAKARDKERRRQAAAAVEAAAPVMTSLATRLDSVAIHLVRRLAREDAAMGLTSVRLSALAVLVANGPCTLGALAHAERVTAPSMTRLITAMESDGLVERIPSAQDGRNVFVRATPRGTSLLRSAREIRATALSTWLLPAGPDGLRCIDEATALLEQVLRDESG